MYSQHPVIRAMRDDWQSRLIQRIAGCLPCTCNDVSDPKPTRFSPTSACHIQHASYRNQRYLIINHSQMMVDPETRRRIYRHSFPRWQHEYGRHAGHGESVDIRGLVARRESQQTERQQRA